MMMLIFAGLLFIAVGGYGLFGQWHFFKRAIMVRGTIVRWALSGGKALWTPVAEFEFDGQRRRVSGTLLSHRPGKTGSLVWVGVNPDNMQEARIKQNGETILYAAAVLSGALIILFSIPLSAIEL